MSAPESPYLAFIVGLHVATALALLLFFWRDWVRIIGGFVTSIRAPRGSSTDARTAGLADRPGTIPVGIAGLLLEHLFRTVLGRPMPAAAFLFANGLILFVGERLRRRRAHPTGCVGSCRGAGPATASRIRGRRGPGRRRRRSAVGRRGCAGLTDGPRRR